MAAFYLNFAYICFHGSNQQYASCGLGKGLVSGRQQAIIWTNDGLVC